MRCSGWRFHSPPRETNDTEKIELVRFVNEQARKLRALALPYRPGISEKLNELAASLDADARAWTSECPDVPSSHKAYRDH